MALEWEFDLPFDEINAAIAERTPPALAKGMEYLRSVVTPLVPEESGHLAGSGGITVTEGVGDGGTAVAEIYYPGPYALYQHEGVYFRRPDTYGAPLRHNHGESFFLKGPAMRESDTVIRVVSEALFEGLI